MSKKLILGPARSGKTHALMQDFVSHFQKQVDPFENSSYFVLPSYEHTERIVTLIVQNGVKGFFGKRVTTLPALIPEVFGIRSENVATNVTRYLIVRQVLEKRNWSYFDEVQNRPGFLNLILSFLSELKESQVPAEVFRDRINGMKYQEPDLAQKYEALAGIYEAYESEMHKRGLRDAQDSLKIYRDLKQKKGFSGRPLKKIWMDGFFDFTELQLGYLEDLCEICQEVVIALTLDTSPSRAELFDPVMRTKDALLKMGFKLVSTLQGSRPSKRKNLTPVRVPPVLDYLEKHLFSTQKPNRKILASDDLQVFEAVGMEGEMEMIARTVLRMRKSRDYRYSDFAVLFRQIGEYESVIRSVFSRFGIPVEVHEREMLRFSPLIQVVVSFLKIFKDGWQRNDVVGFLKSSYVRKIGDEWKDEERVHEFEFAAFRDGIYSGRKVWMESCKDKPLFLLWLQVLADLEDQLRNSRNFQAFRSVLRNAIFRIFGIIQWVDSTDEFVRRDAASMKRLEALWNEVERSFQTSGEAEDPDTLFDRFCERFFRLVDLDLYSLYGNPKNKVQVYDVSMARQKEYRVVFCAGLLEKKFPIQMKEDPVLSDWERQLFNGSHSGGILKERLPRQTMERYLFYVALTRAKEKLFLTYPRFDLEGKESLPSYYVQEVVDLLGGKVHFQRQDLRQPYPGLDEVVNLRELELAVLGGLWTSKEETKSQDALLVYLLNELLRSERTRQRFERAFFEVRDELTDPAIASLDVFRACRTSATGLEEYAKCPFHYYANRVLKLVDPEEDVNLPRRGLILHEVLEKYFKEAHRRPELFRLTESSKALALELLESAVRNHPLILERRFQLEVEYQNAREMLEQFLEKELTRLSSAPLKPRYVEFAFGLDPKGKTSFGIQDGNRTIRIRGKIDRVDVDVKNQLAFLIDYKRAAEFNRKDLALGVALQLPVYSMVIRDLLSLTPVAAVFYSIRNRVMKGLYLEDYGAFFPEGASKRSLLSKEEFENILERGAWFIRKFSREMEALNIKVMPRECSKYYPCPYFPVCRMEKWRLPLILEEIREADEKEGVCSECHSDAVASHSRERGDSE